MIETSHANYCNSKFQKYCTQIEAISVNKFIRVATNKINIYIYFYP